MNDIVPTKSDVKIAGISIYSDEQVAIMKNTVAKGTTNIEFAYFLQVAQSYELSPFKKEVWCYKDSQNNVIVFAGRDGHLAAAQKDSRWNGIASCEIRENDNFRANIPLGKVTHTFRLKDRGKLIGAYAICQPKGCDIRTIEVIDFDTYNKGYATWKTDPAAMIKKVAETHVLKKAYGLSGLASEYDFQVDEATNTVHTIDHEEMPNVQQIEYVNSLINNSTFDDEFKAAMEKKIQNCSHSELDNIRGEMLDNQLDPVKESGNYSKTEIKDRDIPSNF